jgi:hypothetical protein
MTRSSSKTIHTSRTIMFAELSKVMDHAAQDDKYLESLSENITNKRTKSNQEKTLRYLTQLYGFNNQEPAFKCFKYFWQQADRQDQPVLALLYASGRDYLLTESISVVLSTRMGEKVSIEKLMENLDAHHPNKFSANTSRSVAQNIASSWKQAGYITGKVKNIRTQTTPSYLVVTLALQLSYLNGDRGDFILSSNWVKALGIEESQVRDLAFEAAKRDLLQYQYAGAVTTISFQKLFQKLGIHGL